MYAVKFRSTRKRKLSESDSYKDFVQNEKAYELARVVRKQVNATKDTAKQVSTCDLECLVDSE